MQSTDEIRDSDVAVIGMSCRFPGADNVEQFWQNLCAGRETTSFFTDEELLAAGVSAELLADPRHVRAGQILPDIERFDAALFRVPEEEARLLDPQQRHFLECALTALEDSGYDPDQYGGAIGVYAGVGMNTYALQLLGDRFRNASTLDRYRLMLASDKDFLSTRVSYKLNLRGPSVNVNTACSTSLVAVHLACLSLLGGECDIALTGSAHIQVPQTEGYLYQEGMIFSPDGHCRAFDAKAQGTVIGSGVGVVVLKRLSDAVADGDTVHAVIRGTAINNDGALKTGYTAPNVDGQAAVIVDAQRIAGVDPGSIGYVEAHGTGTVLGDPIEVAALTHAFARSSIAPGSCALGSVKTNIGHLDTAAGMAGLIKTVLMLRTGKLVPSLNFESPNPDMDLAAGPFYVNTEFTDWPAGPNPRRAGVSSFGIGGTNAHVVLEQPPVRPVPEPTPASGPQLIVLSANTSTALEQAARQLAGHLRQHRELDLRSVAGTLAMGRRAYGHRRVLVAADPVDAAMTLAVGDPNRVFSASVDRDGRPVAFVCAGTLPDNGGHAVALYQGLPAFRRIVDDCLANGGRTGIDADGVLTAGGPIAAALAEYALATLWGEWGVAPAAVLGLGTGWRAAGCLAGAFDVATMLDPASVPAGAPGIPVWLPEGGWRAAGTPVDWTSAVDSPTSEAVSAALADTAWSPLAPYPAGPLAEPGLPALLLEVGRAWLAGARVNWAQYYAAHDVSRVPLPTYPFQRQRYWIDEAQPAGAGARASGGALGDQFADATDAEKAELVTAFLQTEIGRALGAEQTGGEPPDVDTNLFDMNAESLMLIELTAKLGDELRFAIPSSAFIEYPTIRTFVANLGDLLGFAASGPVPQERTRTSRRARLARSAAAAPTREQ